MATFNIEKLAVQPVGGGSYLWDLPEKASAVHLEGAPIIFDPTNGVGEPATNATAIGLAGVAMQAGQNAAAFTKLCKVAAFLPGLLCEGNLATAAGNITLANTHYGALVGLVKRSTGTTHWVWDPAQTQKQGRIVGVQYPAIVGDVNPRVLVAIMAADVAAIVHVDGWI